MTKNYFIHSILISLILTVNINGHTITNKDSTFNTFSNVLKCLVKTKTIQTDFSIQIDPNNNKIEKKIIHGILTVQLPDKIKIDLTNSPLSLIVTNKKNIIILNKQNNTQYILKSDYELLLKLLDKINNNKIEEIRELFNFRHIGNQDSYKILEMVPATSKSIVKKVIMTTSDKCPGINRILIIDPQNNIYKIDFNSFKYPKQLPVNYFKVHLNKSFKTIQF